MPGISQVSKEEIAERWAASIRRHEVRNAELQQETKDLRESLKNAVALIKWRQEQDNSPCVLTSVNVADLFKDFERHGIRPNRINGGRPE